VARVGEGGGEVFPCQRWRVRAFLPVGSFHDRALSQLFYFSNGEFEFLSSQNFPFALETSNPRTRKFELYS